MKVVSLLLSLLVGYPPRIGNIRLSALFRLGIYCTPSFSLLQWGWPFHQIPVRCPGQTPIIPYGSGCVVSAPEPRLSPTRLASGHILVGGRTFLSYQLCLKLVTVSCPPSPSQSSNRISTILS